MSREPSGKSAAFEMIRTIDNGGTLSSDGSVSRQVPQEDLGTRVRDGSPFPSA